MDEEEAVGVVYMDFSQAFDTISQSIFLKKLAAQGSDGCTVYWEKSDQTAGLSERQRMEPKPAGGQLQTGMMVLVPCISVMRNFNCTNCC